MSWNRMHFAMGILWKSMLLRPIWFILCSVSSDEVFGLKVCGKCKSDMINGENRINGDWLLMRVKLLFCLMVWMHAIVLLPLYDISTKTDSFVFVGGAICKSCRIRQETWMNRVDIRESKWSHSCLLREVFRIGKSMQSALFVLNQWILFLVVVSASLLIMLPCSDDCYRLIVLLYWMYSWYLDK